MSGTEVQKEQPQGEIASNLSLTQIHQVEEIEIQDGDNILANDQSGQVILKR